MRGKYGFPNGVANTMRRTPRARVIMERLLAAEAPLTMMEITAGIPAEEYNLYKGMVLKLRYSGMIDGVSKPRRYSIKEMYIPSMRAWIDDEKQSGSHCDTAENGDVHNVT